MVQNQHIKKQPGRPPTTPQTGTSSISLKIPAHNKQTIVTKATAYGLSITEYLLMLVDRDD